MTIRIDTDFPGGNGRLMEVAPSPRPTVRFAAECRNCPQAMWFHFRLFGVEADTLRCVLTNPDQTLGGPDWSANRPVYRLAGHDWQRTGPAVRIDRPDGRVEWAWDVPTRNGATELAHCLPYQPADLQATLDEVGGVFTSAPIGLSMQGRPIERVYNALPASDRPGVYLTARNHAGETPGSWVLDGLLRHVAAQGDDGPLARRLAWWAAAMVNIDDVVAGSYGKDAYPHDCNRAYGGYPRRPETNAVMADVHRMKHRGHVGILVDLHAPSHREQTTYVPLRGWQKGSTINPIGEAFANRFHAACPAEIRSAMAHHTPAGDGEVVFAGLTASQWAREGAGIDAVTLEVSYQGNGRISYLADEYRRLGAALADTIAWWVLDRRG